MMFESFGGKRAVLQCVGATFKALTPAGARFVAPLSARPKRLVFVCKGNICRSPFGEHLAKRVGLNAVSMGLEAHEGVPANVDAMRQSLLHGVDMSGHRARRFAPGLVGPGDLIICFEVWQAQALEVSTRSTGAQVRLLGAFAGLAHAHLPDPYGHADACFDRGFGVIARAVTRLQSQTERGNA
jgi:protein-tyrosine phosphatase